MPGVDKEGLDINLEKGVLTINGKVDLEERGNQILREFSPANYYRQFKLAEHIDADKSQAELKNGVLTLTIPKAESAKPRKIEIRH
jgi:HSP20 family molecular chaperone IbpA